MADPLSAAASVITVVQLTGDLLSLAYEYIWGVDPIPKDLWELADTLQLFGKVLSSLRNYVQADQSPTLQEINCRNGPLWESALELKRLWLRMVSGEGLRDNAKRLRWPLKEQETFLRIAQINKHKGVFTLALQLMVDRDKLSEAMKGYVQGTSDEAQEAETEL